RQFSIRLRAGGLNRGGRCFNRNNGPPLCFLTEGKGIMVTGFARVLGLIACLLACCCFSYAQEKAAAAVSPDKVKLSVAFSNSEYYDLFSTEYQQGLTAELDARVFKKSGFRLGGVFQFNRANLSASAPLDTYSGGPQFSVDLARGFVSPFGRALFGYRTSYKGDRVFTRAFGLGVDLNLGDGCIPPISLVWNRTEGLLLPATQRYSAGIGVRF